MSYGYVRRQRVNLDWGAIGKEMYTAIQEGEAERQARKADILKQDKERAEQLINQPQGEYAEANRFISEYSEQAQNQALSDLRALKNREISEREYYNRRANLQQGTDLMFTAAKNFNANYDKAMEDIRTGKSSVLLADLKGHMEAYSNFKDHGTFIDPNTGQVNVSKLVQDGGKLVASTRAGDFIDASKLVKMSTANIENVDLDGEIKKVADSLGTIEVTTADGTKIKASLADVQAGKYGDEVRELYGQEITQSLRDYAEAIVGTNIDPSAASILADHMAAGKGGYKLSFDQLVDENGNLLESSKNKMNRDKLIFYNERGQLQITDEQREEAINFVENRLRASLDTLIEPDRIKKVDEARLALQRRKLDDDKKKKKSGKAKRLGYFDVLNDAMSGNEKKSQTALNKLLIRANDKKDDIEYIDIKRRGDIEDGTREFVVTTKDKDGKISETSYPINNPDVDASVLLQLFYPDLEDDDSYESLLADYQAQKGGGFTQETIANPKYDPTKPETKYDRNFDYKTNTNEDLNPKRVLNPDYKGFESAFPTETKEGNLNLNTVTIEKDGRDVGSIIGEKFAADYLEPFYDEGDAERSKVHRELETLIDRVIQKLGTGDRKGYKASIQNIGGSSKNPDWSMLLVDDQGKSFALGSIESYGAITNKLQEFLNENRVDTSRRQGELDN
ncbi:MAG: hypothetical protein CMD25_08430 [Flavobacteriales bacterium]|nr:hypothetical protein [Flavobacteriales bacterium]